MKKKKNKISDLSFEYHGNGYELKELRQALKHIKKYGSVVYSDNKEYSPETARKIRRLEGEIEKLVMLEERKNNETDFQTNTAGMNTLLDKSNNLEKYNIAISVFGISIAGYLIYKEIKK